LENRPSGYALSAPLRAIAGVGRLDQCLAQHGKCVDHHGSVYTKKEFGRVETLLTHYSVGSGAVGALQKPKDVM
jgi:hypothetical protein